MATKREIRAVAFKEGDVWVVQGIDYDIGAQVKDPLDAPLAFMRVLVSTALINKGLGRSALHGVKPAPHRFWDMFERAKPYQASLDEPFEHDGASDDVRLRFFREAHA